MSNSTDSQVESSSATGWKPSIGLATVATLAGGLVAFGIFQPYGVFFRYEALPELPIEPSPEQMAEFTKAHTDFYSRNYGMQLGIVGACIGLVVGGLTVSRKRVVSALVGCFLGMLAGGIAGYLCGFSTALAMVRSSDQSLVQSSLLHFAIWGSIGVWVAAGVGMVQGGVAQVAKAVPAGLIAGVIVVVAHTMVFSIAFPSSNLIQFVPESFAERLTWIVVCGVLLGPALAFLLQPDSRQPTSDAKSEPRSENTEIS